MPWAECVDCGEEFWREDNEPWKRRCIDCWRETKAITDSETTILQAENQRLRQKLNSLEDDLAGIFEHMAFLIFACHPDRNPGKAQVAHKVMVWLNNKRDRGTQ